MRKFIRDGELAFKPVRLDRLVQRVVRLAGGYVRERAQLRVGELPLVDIEVSEALFLQVLANLLRNAANASPTTPRGVVDLKVRVTDAEVIFTVVDDGPGVAPEIADFMFEAFASSSHQGTGLGLAISAYVVQMLEGRLSYRKDPDRGACFTVALLASAARSTSWRDRRRGLRHVHRPREIGETWSRELIKRAQVGRATASSTSPPAPASSPAGCRAVAGHRDRCRCGGARPGARRAADENVS